MFAKFASAINTYVQQVLDALEYKSGAHKSGCPTLYHWAIQTIGRLHKKYLGRLRNVKPVMNIDRRQQHREFLCLLI